MKTKWRIVFPGKEWKRPRLFVGGKAVGYVDRLQDALFRESMFPQARIHLVNGQSFQTKGQMCYTATKYGQYSGNEIVRLKSL